MTSELHGVVEGTVRDIAIDAIYLQIQPVFDIGEKIKIEVILFGDESELTIKMSAVVVRKDKDGVAMRFPHPLDWWPVFTFFPMHKLDDSDQQLTRGI
ncbi:MAG: PilZ domain-containing protein [Desulfocapsa sp.]|nr:PilZ domain-containing protein [Desulfocapsa sp.]